MWDTKNATVVISDHTNSSPTVPWFIYIYIYKRTSAIEIPDLVGEASSKVLGAVYPDITLLYISKEEMVRRSTYFGVPPDSASVAHSLSVASVQVSWC
jgi:hypothetical protein